MSSNNLEERPSLTLPGILDSIRGIGEYVMHAAADARLEQTAAYRLRLAVEEIATNAVVHGYQRVDQEGSLIISATFDDARLVITFVDNGPAYDPRQTPLPDELGKPLIEKPEGGLGIFLALMGVDEYDYQRVKNSNRHIFVQYLDG